MDGEREVNVLACGATGEGQTDDTAAIQKAIDAVEERRGTVTIPPGEYVCSTLRVPSHVGLQGFPTWGYREPGGSILRLADERAACLLDLSGSVGVTVNGLCLEGGGLGEGVHGLMIDKPDYGKQEDNPRIERCRIAHFSGDGVHLNRIWCFSVRTSMLAFNGGSGLWVRGWDGFIIDTWLSGNRGAGYGGYEETSSVTMTGNRIEWNGDGGIVLRAGSHYNICNNYIDRSGKSGISIAADNDYWGRCISLTGNLIYRSGKPNRLDWGEHDSAHVHLERCRGLTATGNTMTVGRDDGNKGDWSPEYGMVYGELADSVIQANVLHNGALRELMVDLGGHADGVIVRDNPGSLSPEG